MLATSKKCYFWTFTNDIAEAMERTLSANVCCRKRGGTLATNSYLGT